MLSEQTKEGLNGLEIEHEAMSNNAIRLKLEDLVDSVEQLVNTEDHAKQKVIHDVYSSFMEDYTVILDRG